METQKRNTLFVRNLPYTTTKDKFESLFSDIGPVKSCFVVNEKGSDKCRGFGYVTYSLLDDAETAKNTIQNFEGRKLHIHYADRKPREKKGKKKDDSEATPDVIQDVKTPKVQAVARQTKPAASKRPLLSSTVIVSGLPEGSTAQLSQIISKLQNVQNVECPAESHPKANAVVTFPSKHDAQKALHKMSQVKVQGVAVRALLLSQEKAITAPKYLKKCRLIVRNLAFKCTEEKLKEKFAAFGEVSEVTIPKKPDGRMRGFGFVQFTRLKAASKAVHEMNTKEILGRPVAVDWTVPKEKYDQSKTPSQPSAQDQPGIAATPHAAHSDTSDDSGSFSAEEISHDQPKAKQRLRQESSDTSNSDDTSDTSDDDSGGEDGGGSSEEEEDEEEEEEEEDEEEDEEESGFSESGSDASDQSDDDDEGFAEDARRQRPSDTEAGRTLFIRNLSFDSHDEELEEMFSEYGDVTYCVIVTDPNTEHSKGTAFVKFGSQEAANKAMAAAEDEMQGGLVLDGRRLNVILALPRANAEKLCKEAKTKQPKDNRNLHLAREGLIRAGTQAAEGLAKEDVAKRTKVEAVKRQKLKDPNIFISPLRLCVRNIPVATDDGQLKRKMLQCVQEKGAKITECRIMRDLARVNTQGVAKSRGYGFVAFSEHKHALQALRNTNNNPAVFGEKRRLIVEFSLENRAALTAKAKRVERCKVKQAMLKKPQDGSTAGSGTYANVKRPRNSTQQAAKIVTTVADTSTDGATRLPKGMPSHSGVKQRHRDRGKPKHSKKQMDKQSRQEARQNTQKRKQDELQTPQQEGPKPKKPKKGAKSRRHPGNRHTDDLDQLVNKYRQKFSAVIPEKSSGKKTRGKWFQ